MKIVNGGPVLDAFRETDREEREGTLVTISRKLSSTPPRMIERIGVSGSRGSGQYERRQRLYRVEEASAALVRAGLSIIEVFASPNGAAFEPTTSTTMWVVGQAGGPV